MAAPTYDAAPAAVPDQAELSAEAQDAAWLLAAREHLYLLFHKLTGGAPTPELLRALASDGTLAALGAYAEESAELAAVRSFVASLRDADPDGLLDAAKDEYTRLFIGPAQPVAVPWESPYRTHMPAAVQESTLEVRASYRAQGLEPRRLLRVPDDHVSLMCVFMADLGERSIAALGTGGAQADAGKLASTLRAQEAFVLGHLVGWLPDYARMARRSKTAVLYPQTIEALADFVAVDATFLSESSLWAETAGVIPDFGRTEETERLRRSTAELAGIRPFGIEDNELVAVAAQPARKDSATHGVASPRR